MKNFNLLIEQVQNLLLENVNYKPLYKKIQEHYLKIAKVKSYDDLTDELKKGSEEFVILTTKNLDEDLSKIPNINDNDKQWVVNVFSSGQQDWVTDQEKIIDQLQQYTDLRKHDRLTKEQKNLNALSYNDFYNILKTNNDLGEIHFGNNEIIHEDGEWKIIEFKNYEDALPFVVGSKSNWCIKHENMFNFYNPPYYAFYRNNKAYALFHVGSAQLKDIEDEPFTEFEEGFTPQIKWLFDNKNVKNLHAVDEDRSSEMSVATTDLFELADNHPEFEKYFVLEELLYVAVDHGYKGSVASLLKQPKIKINKKFIYGNTALHLACESSNVDIVKLLIAHPKIKVNIQNEEGDTPIDVAKRNVRGSKVSSYNTNQATEIVKLLQDKGAL